MKSIERMMLENLRMANHCAVDKYPTFPVTLRYFLFLLIHEDC